MTAPAPGGFVLPPGTFRIDREGVWHHEGREVTHPGVLRNLYANLRASDRGHHLEVGPSRIPVEVEDTPYVVTRVEPAAPEAGLSAHLTDGTVERLDVGSLRLGAGGIPYCRVKGGRFAARLSLAAWLQLAPFVEEDAGSGGVAVVVSGRRVPLARGDAR